jgi:hypothetical protein
MIKFKDIVRFALSFFLMFVLILMQISFFINNKVLNGDFYKAVLQKGDYFTLMRKEIDYGFKNLSMITSIPEEIFSISVKDDEIKELSYRNITSAENYMKYKNSYVDNKWDTSVLSSSLEKYSENYAKENNIKIDAAFEKQILAVVQDSGKIIENHAVLFNISAVDKYAQFQVFRKVLNIFSRSLMGWVILVCILMILLALLNRRRAGRTFLWIGSSFIPAALMTLVPSALAMYYKIPYKFAVDTSYLKLALKNISLEYIKYFIITGSFFIIIGIINLCIYTYLSNRTYEKTSALGQTRL